MKPKQLHILLCPLSGQTERANSEASAQDPLQQLIALNAQHFLRQVQVFFLVCDTCAKQHWKTSTGAIDKKNTSNLKCRLEEDRLWMTKMFTS